MATLGAYKTIIIKIGSSLLVDEDTGRINDTWLQTFAQDIAKFKRAGAQILIVSSGAIALGRTRLNLNKATLTLAQKQACAAAGQALLTQAYEAVLSPYNLVTAQALLTLNDTENRRNWINAKATLTTLFSLGAVPIVNENDTVATDEIRYGDNDRLAARVAQMVGADLLVLLSDIDGLYSTDPSQDNTAQHIPLITELTPDIMAMGGNANSTRGTGTGGMATKLQAAKIATEAGCTLVITKGSHPYPLTALDENTILASWFKAKTNIKAARKQWIAATLKPKGILTIDTGAHRALMSGKSLLGAGVIQVEGAFDKGDAVVMHDMIGQEIGRGLVGYSASDADKIKGMKSKEISNILGYDGSMPFIHRDNMVLDT
ncbi:MAG: glutamate 5-kinase [Robiginitomaculum sp.]|nr:MAG: glutamate 5-kinase [Robiginitomaculum sp.]